MNQIEEKTLANRAQLAGKAFNAFCPTGLKTDYRKNAFFSFMNDYDLYPAFDLKRGLSELKDVKTLLMRIDDERRVDGNMIISKDEAAIIISKIEAVERIAKDQSGVSKDSNAKINELNKQIEEANKKLLDSEVQHKKSLKTMRRRYWSGIALSVTLAAVGLAAKFGYFDGVKSNAERFFFGETHAKAPQSRKIDPPKPLAPLSHINPTAIAQWALEKQTARYIQLRR